MKNFFLITIISLCNMSCAIYAYNSGTSHANGRYQIDHDEDKYQYTHVYPFGNVDKDYGVVNMTLLTLLTPAYTTEMTRFAKKKKKVSVGSYDIRTGDELYLNDFVMRPKFITKNESKHVLGYEYGSGKYGGNGTFLKIVTSTRTTPTDNPRYGPNRRPQTSINRQENKTKNKVKKPNSNQPHRKNPHRPATNSNTIQKNKNHRKPAQQNKKKLQQKQNSRNVCKNTNPKTTNRKPNKQTNNRGQKPHRKINNRRQNNGLGNWQKPKGNVKRKVNNKFAKVTKNMHGHRERSLLGMTFDQIRNQSANLANKFLSFFKVVGVSNYRCSAGGVPNLYEGMCYQEKQCLELGGSIFGNCVEYGVCCVFKFTCGGTSNQNYTYFQSPKHLDYDVENITEASPHYPDESIEDQFSLSPTLFIEGTEATRPIIHESDAEEYADFETVEDLHKNSLNKYKEYTIGRRADLVEESKCVFEVFKATENIHQMKIDFIDFELSGPDSNGNCLEERLIISGLNLNILPTICGYNSGQHVYVDVSTLSGPLRLSILSTVKYGSRYKIRVSQLETPCENSMNCLQYFSGIHGMVASFNYDQASRYARSKPGYLSNLNYALCIRREIGYCSTTFTNVDEDNNGYAFDIRNLEEEGVSSCPKDFILINNIRYCGQSFEEVTDRRPGPIILSVQTDERINGRGFKLFYTQNKCVN